jgi:hypothetical protein
MARDGTPVGCAGERADDTCANKDREVKAILRVPLGCYKLVYQFGWSTPRLSLRTPSSTGRSKVCVPEASKSDPLNNQRHDRFKSESRPSVDHGCST